MSSWRSTHPSLIAGIQLQPHPTDPLIWLMGGSSVPSGPRGAYGGMLVAQCLHAASKTVKPPLGLHSGRCYFLLPAPNDKQIEFKVEKLSDGRSMACRLVKACQGEKVVCISMASFALPGKPLPKEAWQADGTEESGLVKVSNSLTMMSQPWGEDEGLEDSRPRATYQVPFPEHMLPFEECEDNMAYILRQTREKGEKELGYKWQYWQDMAHFKRGAVFTTTAARRKPDAPYNPDYYHKGLPTTRMAWYQPMIYPEDVVDHELAKIMLAFISDYQLAATASRAAGLNTNSTPALNMLASIDHSIHFYPFPANYDPRRPVLHVKEAQYAHIGGGRGIARGRIYTEDGHLLALTAQEGIMRAQRPGEPRRRMPEAGVDEEDLNAKL
ncbi:acyl-CoA thioesterase II [Cryptococcus sp. DSM 104549]